MTFDNNNLMVSLYQNFKTNLGESNLMDMFQHIKSEKYQSDINSIRYALHKGENKTADEIKSGLIGFTTSGTFGESRTKANLNSYSQIIGLDFDHIPVEDLNNLASKINDCEHTIASFISPSGEGLKVFIKVSTNAEQHTAAYNHVANFYKELSGYDFDPKCKDITRLCFVSSDSKCFINEAATIFEVQHEKKETTKEQKKEIAHNLTTDELLDKCLKFTEQKEQYYNGNRNNYIYQLACNANKYGINQEETLDFCLNNFDLTESEIKSSINSAYKNQIADFANFANFANLQTDKGKKTKLIEQNSGLEEDFLKTTPMIPMSVYENLPPILFEGSKAFTNSRERDVFLTGALAIISGCLPNVSGIYSGSIVYPNLFTFVLAPAASGKGALKHAKVLADEYHKKTLEQSKVERKKYDEELEVYNNLNKKNKLEPNQELPQEPKFRVVHIPANTSNAKVIQHLDWNGGKGIICETEADTLGQTFKNDWGGYSDMLRKAFHHEKISSSRKTDNEFVEVEQPQLSIALSGTPKQVFNIITSAEDGLFSRFLFYVFETNTVWLDPSPKGNPINLTEYFSNLSKRVMEVVDFYQTDSMALHFTDHQWDTFNDQFSLYLGQISLFISNDAESVVKRLGLILYRFCMIFTAIRKFGTKDHSKDKYCSDTDFDSALTLTEVYLQHSIIMFNNLPKQGEHDAFKSGQNKKHFFDALPASFQRKEAIELAKKFNIGERSVGTLLKACLAKYLLQPKTGFYQKIS